MGARVQNWCETPLGKVKGNMQNVGRVVLRKTDDVHKFSLLVLK